MKKLIFISVAILAAISLGYMYFVQVTIPRETGLYKASSNITGTYANSQVDTVRWIRDPFVQSIGFWTHWADSANVTIATVRRVYNGVAQALIVGDTLGSFTAYSAIAAAQAAHVRGAAFPLQAAASATAASGAAPEEIWITITYAATGNGVTNNVKYGITPIYSAR